jgi:hypothetical protein
VAGPTDVCTSEQTLTIPIVERVVLGLEPSRHQQDDDEVIREEVEQLNDA